VLLKRLSLAQKISDYRILVSHDRSFLDNCVDHILSINKTNIEIQKGNFSDWWENKKRQDSFEFAENEKLRKDIKRLSNSAKRTGNGHMKWKKLKTVQEILVPR
jgi:lincosamide and streptogramin A transport system ATP-binding/permease protein